MAGRTKDFNNRQDNFLISSLSSIPADLLINRLLYLLNHINVLLGLIEIDRRNGSFDCFSIIVDDEITLRQEISQFIGLLFYIQRKHKKLLIPHRAEIMELKNKLGFYFI